MVILTLSGREIKYIQTKQMKIALMNQPIKIYQKYSKSMKKTLVTCEIKSPLSPPPLRFEKNFGFWRTLLELDGLIQTRSVQIFLPIISIYGKFVYHNWNLTSMIITRSTRLIQVFDPWNLRFKSFTII